MAAAEPPFSIQFIGKAVFRDRVLVPMDLELFERVQLLNTCMHNLSAHDMAVDSVPDESDLVILAEVMCHARQTSSQAIHEISIAGLDFREIPDASAGVEEEEVDPEVFALTHLTLAMESADKMVGDREGSWQWITAMAIVRRLERVIARSRHAGLRAIETAPSEWTEGRRAVDAAMNVLLVLLDLKTSTLTRRAAAHAAFALAVQGLHTRRGVPVPEAAVSLLPRMLDAPTLSRTGVEPHRLRTTSIVATYSKACTGTTRTLPGLSSLVNIAYSMALNRCPDRVRFNLGRIDLLAGLLSRAKGTADDVWVSALIASHGTVPPGTVVGLADGNMGTVVGPGSSGEPWRPQVLVNGRLVEPDRPISMISPASAASGSRMI